MSMRCRCTSRGRSSRRPTTAYSHGEGTRLSRRSPTRSSTNPTTRTLQYTSCCSRRASSMPWAFMPANSARLGAPPACARPRQTPGVHAGPPAQKRTSTAVASYLGGRSQRRGQVALQGDQFVVVARGGLRSVGDADLAENALQVVLYREQADL